MKNKNFRYSAISNIIFALISLAICIFLIVISVEMAKQTELLMEYQIMVPIVICLMFVTACLAFANGLTICYGYKKSFSLNISKLVFLLLTIIAFTAFVTYFSFGDYYIFYLLLSFADFAFNCYEYKKNKKAEEDVIDYTELENKVKQLNQLRDNNIIDEEQYQKLKTNYTSKFLKDELGNKRSKWNGRKKD